jgi:outer membrane murein-binding lipoprotein Lpp
MRPSARTLFTPRALIGLLAVALLAGCASGPDKEQCVATDWRTVGYEDGLRGAPADRIGGHRAACGKHGVTPDLGAYLDGRERGLKEYCQPKNGFRVGLHGGGYANVCSGATETAFVDAYRWGRQIYDARSTLRHTQSQLRSSRDGLVQTDTAMANVTAELVLATVPVERRAFLATELVRLTQERSALVARIDQLTVRSQELATNVQQLERQSPYML